MRKKFCEMPPEEKAAVYARTERYRAKNRELYNAAARKYYHANKEICAERARRWRELNKGYIVEKQREQKRARKLWAVEYLGGVCARCKSVVHPAAFEFHHRDPSAKDRDPSKTLSLSMARLTAELDKCNLLCANCHRVVHFEMRESEV